MNWYYERWMAPKWIPEDWAAQFEPVVFWIRKPWPWECVALVKEGPKSIVLYRR